MRGASGACARTVALVLLAAAASHARAQSPEELLAREVPEAQPVNGESPRATADGIVRALLARFEQAAHGGQLGGGAGALGTGSPTLHGGPQPGASPSLAPSVPAPSPTPVEAAPEKPPVPTALRKIEPIYRYRDAQGRIVYTNVAENVPLETREQSELDLSRISLNTTLGNELSARLRAEHAARIKAPICAELRAALDVPLLLRAWQEHAPLFGIGLLLILFLTYAPFLLKRFGVSLWTRMLATIIPLMALFALGAHAYDRSRTSLSALRQKAEPCFEEAFARLTGQGAGLPQQAELVRSLVELGAGGGAPTTGAR